LLNQRQCSPREWHKKPDQAWVTLEARKEATTIHREMMLCSAESSRRYRMIRRISGKRRKGCASSKISGEHPRWHRGNKRVKGDNEHGQHQSGLRNDRTSNHPLLPSTMATLSDDTLRKVSPHPQSTSQPPKMTRTKRSWSKSNKPRSNLNVP